MMESIAPRYESGQRVMVTADLFNDGSFPEHPPEALLISSGEAGEVVQVGHFADSGTFVYVVEFALNRLVGCFEHELTPALSNGGTQ